MEWFNRLSQLVATEICTVGELLQFIQLAQLIGGCICKTLHTCKFDMLLWVCMGVGVGVHGCGRGCAWVWAWVCMGVGVGATL